MRCFTGDHAPFGRAIAPRDNERRARSLGFAVYRARLTAFVISGALAGLAGYFAAAQFGYVAPQMLGWHQSAIALVMVMLGGMRSVIGPLAGAVVLLGLEEWLKATTEHWKLAEGLIVIAIVLAFPAACSRCSCVFPRLIPKSRVRTDPGWDRFSEKIMSHEKDRRMVRSRAHRCGANAFG